MVEAAKKQIRQYLESGNVLDDPEKIESVMLRIETRLLNTCDAQEVERLSQLLRELEQYITFLN